jgi:hypothetical protein
MTQRNLSSNADHSNTIDRDGVCPICNQPGVHYYLEGGEHWCACPLHSKNWYIGQNDGSENWRTMPPEVFARNRRFLSWCDDVADERDAADPLTLKIRIRPNNCFVSTNCQICGGCFRLGEANAAFFYIAENSDGGHDEGWADVCPECIAAGPDGMKQRARQCAERAAENARYEKERADGLANMTIVAPTASELEAARVNGEKENTDNSGDGGPPF